MTLYALFFVLVGSVTMYLFLKFLGHRAEIKDKDRELTQKEQTITRLVSDYAKLKERSWAAQGRDRKGRFMPKEDR